MHTYEIEAYFEKGYIGNPYWPEVAKLIDVQKISGMSRARSDANRRKALEEYLQSQNMTVADYDELQRLAARPFYTLEPTGEIIIPELHVGGFLVATCHQARARTRPCEPEQVRSRFIFSHWSTGKKARDAVWTRAVVVNSGTGQTLSNQRRMMSSEFIEKFTARGTFGFDPDFVDPETAKRALEWGGQFVGIGAARKMGWGRFTLKKFARLDIELKDAAE